MVVVDVRRQRWEDERRKGTSGKLIVARSSFLRSFRRQFMSWAPPDFILEAANEALANTMANHYS